MTTKYFKVKNKRQIRIRKPKSIVALNKQGFAVSKVTIKGNQTEIKTWSARKKR